MSSVFDPALRSRTDLGHGVYEGEASIRSMPGMLPEDRFFELSQARLSSLPEGWGMLSVDVMHFRLFQELNGRESSGRLLRGFGETLLLAAEECGGLTGYRGQDLFCLLAPCGDAPAEKLFGQLKAVIDRISSLNGFYPILGICPIEKTDLTLTAAELFNRAALAAEEIKDDLQHHIRVYRPRQHQKHVEEFRLLTDFQSALREGEITFYLQPQCLVSTGQIVGAESLARWQRKDGSFISPGVFVPVLEKYGLITHLDMHIWELVCAWIRRMLDAGQDPVPVSVNISRIDLFTIDVPACLRDLTERFRVPVHLLKVEITESAYVEDSDKIRDAIAELHGMGFQVLMDDFGSGYSSLNMLQNTELDVIKLDAQFFRFSRGEEQKGIQILESVINMTKALRTPLIAEGVESHELVHYLSDMGCRYMQGFYFYRPMPFEQFEHLIQLPNQVDHKGIQMQSNQQIHIRELLDEHLYSDAMLNNILGPVAFYRLRGKEIDIIRYNQQFYQLVGLDPDQLEGRLYQIQHFFYPADLEGFYRMLETARQDRINGASGMYRIYRPNGALVWLQVHVYYLTEEPEGSVFYASARDMTELQYVNLDLPGGYYRCAVDDAFTLRYTSHSFLSMLGYTPEELQEFFQNQLIRMVHPEDRESLIRQARLVREGKGTEFTPYRLLHRSGDYLYVVDQSRLSDRYGELCWQSILVDITSEMTLRNRMRLLEKYSTDIITFVRRKDNHMKAEIAVYGLGEELGMDREAFLQALSGGEFSTWVDGDFNLCRELTAHFEHPEALNGLYLLHLPCGRDTRLAIRFDRIRDDAADIDCIISFDRALDG